MLDRQVAFVARRVAVSDDPDAVVAALAENADGTGNVLIFSLAASFDDQDRVQGMNTYCLIGADQQTVYGGIRRWELTADGLLIDLAPGAAQELGMPQVARIGLAVDPIDRARLGTGLGRIVGLPDER